MDKIKILLYGFFTYLGLDLEHFAILMGVMLFDTLVGSIKAVRLGYEFNFRTLLWGITMKFIFLFIPVLIAVAAKQLNYDFTLGIDVIMSILTISEVYSALGNIYSAKNKVEVKKIDAVSMLIVSLRQALGTTIKKALETLENLGKKE